MKGEWITLDGDEIAYYFAYKHTNEEDMINAIQYHIQALQEYLHAELVSIYLSCPRSEGFRRKLFPGYKKHRDKRDPPKLLGRAREFLKLFYNAVECGRLEADDLLGLEASQSIRVTQDKDAATVPGRWLNPRTMEYKVITKEEALYNLMTQVLTGDTADGYKGVPGIGKKKAEKILQGTTHRGWQKIYRAFLKVGLTRRDMWINYRMAKILTRRYE